MRRFVFLSFVLLFLFPAWASAFKVGGITVLIPIVGRFPGALGTQWRTDVFIANHTSVSKSANLTFYVAGGSPMTSSVSLEPYSTASLRDIVLNTFGLSSASGQLKIDSSNTSILEARARIYNAGNPAGEFGQNVPGIGSGYLSPQASLYCVSGINGNRVNVGVANPNDTDVNVHVRISDANNVTLYTGAMIVGAHQTAQINDIFTAYGIAPQADVQVEFNSNGSAIYGYASEVRNDTGDAIFVVGSSPNA